MTKRACLPSSTPRAVIFDMDGVLLDSEPLHHEAVNQMLASEGKRPLSPAEYVPYMGTTDAYTWNDLIARFQLGGTVDSYCSQYDETILELYRRRSEIAPGAIELLDAISDRNLATAVASSSKRAWVETCLAALGIRDRFNLVITGDMVSRSKPDPEIYLLAARCLGIPATSAIAIEDSPNGIASAVAAGMFTIAVGSTYPTNRQTAGAHQRIESLMDFDRSILSTCDRDSYRLSSKARNL